QTSCKNQPGLYPAIRSLLRVSVQILAFSAQWLQGHLATFIPGARVEIKHGRPHPGIRGKALACPGVKPERIPLYPATQLHYRRKKMQIALAHIRTFGQGIIAGEPRIEELMAQME